MGKSISKNLNEDFFCDGPYYFLTSSSLGDSNLSAKEITDLLQSEDGVKKILSEGIGFPMFFPGDCALDGCTKFVIGDLSKKEEKNWLGKITSKLNIPCGKALLIAGGGDEEYLQKAISGEKQDKDYVFYDTLEITKGNYLIELYCYIESMNFDVEFDDWSDLTDSKELIAMQQWYKNNLKDIGYSYIIRFSPLIEEPELPKLVEEVSWCGVFDYRKP